MSRQHEAAYFRYYGYPYYWGGAGLWGIGAYPGGPTTKNRIEEELKDHRAHATGTPDDRHLRSSNAVIGHQIEATDGDIGHVEDLLVDHYTCGDYIPDCRHQQLVGRSARAHSAKTGRARK